MKVRRIEISRFRGIKSLDWVDVPDVAFLLGSGDSGKSTVLDAIELVLSPRWAIQFDDTDFYGCDAVEPLSITVTVGDLSEELTAIKKFGLNRRGWKGGALVDEPEDGSEPVIVVRLDVTGDLEPTWHVLGRHDELVPVSGTDRERFGMIRIGHNADRQLAWGRGTALTRLTDTKESLSSVLADASRAARGNVDRTKIGALDAAAAEVQKRGKEVGVRPSFAFQAHLDAAAMSLTSGGFALHDGEVPVRRAGQGTRRLLAMSMQRPESPSIVLIDEVETGLEPHRLRRLIRVLRGAAGQVLGTTHSPVAVAELDPRQLAVVQLEKGTLTVRQPSEHIRPTLRTSAESLLGRRVIVCEGKTELGFCRGLDAAWCAIGGLSFAYCGLTLADGGGDTKAPGAALALRSLGFEVALLMDSDTDNSKPAVVVAVQAARSGGVVLIRWTGNTAIEERLALDLPPALLVEMIAIAVDEKGGVGPVRDAVQAAMPKGSPRLGEDPADWLREAGTDVLRRAVGLAAKGKKNGWYKRVDLGERLGFLVGSNLALLAGTDLARCVEIIKTTVQVDD